MPSFFVPNEARIEVNRYVLFFCAAVAALTGVLFGLAPALQSSRPDLVAALKDDARNSGADTSDTPWIEPEETNAKAGPAPSAYSHPIVFLPDGTAREDVAIAFVVKGARRTTLNLRGLTGSTSVTTE